MAQVSGHEQLVLESYNYIVDQVSRLPEPWAKVCQRVTQDPRWSVGYGARSRHHAYPGGLVVHTAEVLENALNLAQGKSLEVDKVVLVTAALFHDYGKIYDHEHKENGETVYTKHGELVRHVVRSYAEFLIVSQLENLEPDRVVGVSHAIIAHHGRPEWGAAKEPATVEAEILHYADMISYKYSKDLYNR